MSRLQELLDQYCPDGVEQKRIADIASYEQPGKYLVSSTDYSDEFDTPVLTAGQTFVLGYTDEKTGIYPASKDDPVIIFDDFTGAFKWVDFPFKAKSSAMKMIKARGNIVLLRYLYHMMGFLNYTSDEHKRLWISVYSEFEVPVPPIEVQREIVRILDSFTELTTELNTKLADELAARRKQYEYYRDALLDFDNADPNSWLGKLMAKYCPNGVEYKELVAVCGFISGFAFKSSTFSETGEPVCKTTNIRDGAICFDDMDCVFVSQYKEDLGKYIVSPHDIVIGMSGTIKVGINDTKRSCYLNQRVGKFMPDESVMLNKYLYYVLCSSEAVLAKGVSGGSVKNLSNKDVLSLLIPVPPLELQMEIVKVLDRFSSLCSDISSGLPAEIAARQKQYEYYRDRLLSF